MWPEAHLGQGRATGTHGCQRPKVVEGSKQAWVGGEGGVDGVEVGCRGHLPENALPGHQGSEMGTQQTLSHPFLFRYGRRERREVKKEGPESHSPEPHPLHPHPSSPGNQPLASLGEYPETMEGPLQQVPSVWLSQEGG